MATRESQEHPLGKGVWHHWRSKVISELPNKERGRKTNMDATIEAMLILAVVVLLPFLCIVGNPRDHVDTCAAWEWDMSPVPEIRVASLPMRWDERSALQMVIDWLRAYAEGRRVYGYWDDEEMFLFKLRHAMRNKARASSSLRPCRPSDPPSHH